MLGVSVSLGSCTTTKPAPDCAAAYLDNGPLFCDVAKRMNPPPALKAAFPAVWVEAMANDAAIDEECLKLPPVPTPAVTTEPLR